MESQTSHVTRYHARRLEELAKGERAEGAAVGAHALKRPHRTPTYYQEIMNTVRELGGAAVRSRGSWAPLSCEGALEYCSTFLRMS